MATTNVDAVIDQIASNTDKSRSAVETLVDEKLREWRDEERFNVDDSTIDPRRAAAMSVKSDLTGPGSSGRDGLAEAVPTLALGWRSETPALLNGDGGIRAAGVINPADAPAGLAVFILDSGDGVDIDHARRAFQPLQTVRVTGDLRQVGTLDSEPTVKKAGTPTYTVESTPNTTLEVAEPAEVDDDDPIGELPAGQEAKRQLVHQNFLPESEAVTLSTYAEHEAQLNANGWPAGFGIDMKRIRGEVVDAVRFDYGDALLTITDDTVFDDGDVEDELIGDQQRTAGMQVEVAGEHVVGEGSIVDVYGYIRQRDDGQYQMMGFGVVPIVEFEYDDGVVETGGGDATDESIDETTIGGGA